MGRTKGAADMRPRKKRTSRFISGRIEDLIQQAVVPITQPIFSSSNNRRGNGTAQQRLFAAHFQATDATKVVIEPTPHLDQSLVRIEPVPTFLDEDEVYEPVDHVNEPETDDNYNPDTNTTKVVIETTPLYDNSSVLIEPCPTYLDDNEVHDPVELMYDPETDDEYNPDSDDEDYDDDEKDPPRFCPELERAIAVLLKTRQKCRQEKAQGQERKGTRAAKIRHKCSQEKARGQARKGTKAGKKRHE